MAESDPDYTRLDYQAEELCEKRLRNAELADVIRHRAFTESYLTSHLALIERVAVAEERKASALEGIAACLSKRQRKYRERSDHDRKEE